MCYVRERFPEKFRETAEKDLVELVRNVRDRASAYDVSQEADVATAVDLTVMYESNFYALDWARDVFAVKDWSGSEKMDVLRQRVRRQVQNF